MLKQEALLVWRDRAVWLALVLTMMLGGISLWNGFSWLREQRAVDRRAAAAEKADYDSRKAQVTAWQNAPPAAADTVLPNLYDPRTPYAVGQVGRLVQLPLTAMAATCVGQLDFLPLRQRVSIRTRMRTVDDKASVENPLALLSGRFDLAFVIVYLLPLLVIAASYNLLSLEREQGTLALVRSQPVDLWQVFARKAGLRGVVLIGGAVGFASLVLALSGGWREPVRLGLWGVVAAAYGLFWWSLAFWVNSRHSSSAVNATLLVTGWLAFVAVMPSLLQLTVQAIQPAPSRLELIAAIRDRSIDQRRDGKPLAEAWYAEHPELRAPGVEPRYDTAVTGTMTHIEQDRRTLPLERRFDEQVAAQQDLVSSLRFVSPAIVAYEALQDVAGTGTLRHRHFRAQARAFREEWLGWFHPRIFRHMTLDPGDYNVLPAFVYREEPALEWVRRVLSGAAGLAAIALVFLWLTRRNLRQFGVT